MTSSAAAEPVQEKVSRAWYLLPILLAILGGLIGYLGIRGRNTRIARRVLLVGGAFTIVYLVAYAGIGSSMTGSNFLNFQSGSHRTNPDGGTALYIEHIRFANGTITVVIQNYANGNSELGRILVDNTTGSQVFDPNTAVYADYGNPCNPNGPCGFATGASNGFQLAGYIYANNTKSILTPNTQYYSVTIGPYPAETTVTLPYHYVAGYRYWIVLQDPNNNNYDIAYNIPSSSASTVNTIQTAITSTVPPAGLYIASVVFGGENVTVSVSNSGGGTPIVGYGNTGQIARWFGSIIIFNGTLYSRWAWSCPPSDSCSTAPGPWRYFTFEGTSTTLDVPWNQGPGTYYGAPMTVGGLTSVPLTYKWTPGATYQVYLEDLNNTIVYEQTAIAPG